MPSAAPDARNQQTLTPLLHAHADEAAHAGATPLNASHHAAISAALDLIARNGGVGLIAGAKGWGRPAVLDAIAAQAPEGLVIERIEGVALDLPTLMSRLGAVLGVPMTDASDDLRAAAAALTDALESLAAEDQRVLLLIDAGDGASARALLMLERLSRSSGMTCVIAARAALRSALAEGKDDRLRALAQGAIDVRRFTREEVEAILRDRAPALADGSVEAIWSRTAGAPEPLGRALAALAAATARVDDADGANTADTDAEAAEGAEAARAAVPTPAPATEVGAAMTDGAPAADVFFGPVAPPEFTAGDEGGDEGAVGHAAEEASVDAETAADLAAIEQVLEARALEEQAREEQALEEKRSEAPRRADRSDSIDDAAAALTASFEPAIGRQAKSAAAQDDGLAIDDDGLWLEEHAPRRRGRRPLMVGAAAVVAAAVIAYGAADTDLISEAGLTAKRLTTSQIFGSAADVADAGADAEARSDLDYLDAIATVEAVAADIDAGAGAAPIGSADESLATADAWPRPTVVADAQAAPGDAHADAQTDTKTDMQEAAPEIAGLDETEAAPRPTPRPARAVDPLPVAEAGVETDNALSLAAETALGAARAGAEALASKGVLSETLDDVAAAAHARRVALSRARQQNELDPDAVEQRVRSALILADRRLSVKQYTEPSGVSAYDVLLNAWEVAPTDPRLNKRFNRLVEVYRGEARRALAQERFGDFYRFNTIVDRILTRRPV